VEQRSSGTVRMGPGTLYGSLQRMCAAGLLEASEQRPPAELDDPRRRYYRVTELGRAAARLEAERLAALLRLAEAKRVYRGPRGATAGSRSR
jgi:DNA-binding PadR family transcriptional regulator